MVRKEFANIGKQILRQISGFVEIYQSIIKECFNQNEINELSVTENYNSISENKFFRAERRRLSKSQILQFIYYHFLQVDQRGVITQVSEKSIAKVIGCNIQTVRNNNVVLEDAQLIYHSRSDRGINVWIVPYKYYFQEGGSGYLILEFNRFLQLVEIANVNSLRFELREELSYDNNTFKRLYKKNGTVLISKNDLRLFLPKYAHSKSMIESIVERGSKTFQATFNGSNIQFTAQAEYRTGKLIKDQKKEEYRAMIEKTMKQFLNDLSPYDINSFIQLAFDYGIENVLNGLEKLKEELNDPELIDPILNYGGKLRTIIRMVIYGSENKSQV